MDSRAHPYGRIGAELAGSPFAAITYVAETDSTNADAAKLLGRREHLGRSIVAEHQRQGRGRKGRRWTSQPGSSLLVTSILPRALDAADVWVVPFWVALAVREALARLGVTTTLHWPNDLSIEERKVAGVLCTSRITADTAWVACGVGINVYRPQDPQTDVAPPAAYCDDVVSIDRARLLGAILREYDATLDRLGNPGRTAALWEAAAGLPGARYRILKDGATEAFETTALRLGRDGGLVVDLGDGRLETIALADARALR